MIDCNPSELLFFIANLYQPLMRPLPSFSLRKLVLALDLLILIPYLPHITRNLPQQPLNVISFTAMQPIMPCCTVLFESIGTITSKHRVIIKRIVARIQPNNLTPLMSPLLPMNNKSTLQTIPLH